MLQLGYRLKLLFVLQLQKNIKGNTPKQSCESERMQDEELKPISESKGIPPPPPLQPSVFETTSTVKSVENIWMRKDLIPTDNEQQ